MNVSRSSKGLMGLGAVALAGIAGLAIAQTTKPADKAKPYPLQTCIVSDEKLGSMGDPEVIVYQGQEIKFCCNNCPADFKKDPDKFLKKLEVAAKAPATRPAGG